MSQQKCPADIGSRGILLSKTPGIWWGGSSWIIENNKWPDQLILNKSKEPNIEAKIIKDILAATVKVKDFFDLLLNKYKLHKILRVSTWVTKFINNCRSITERGL